MANFGSESNIQIEVCIICMIFQQFCLYYLIFFNKQIVYKQLRLNLKQTHYWHSKKENKKKGTVKLNKKNTKYVTLYSIQEFY